MNEAVVLLLLRHLFPEWAITRDEAGSWWATGRVLVSSNELDGLLEVLAVADPGTTRRAIRLLKEKRPSGC